MDYNNKRKVANHVTYIVLAIMLASIMLITIFAAISSASKRQKNTPADETTVSSNEETKTATSQTEKSPETAPPALKETEADVEDVISPAISSSENVSAENELTVNRTLPVKGTVLKNYSYDTPVYSITMNDYRSHLGIDISASEGDPVYAFMSGTVTDVSSDYFMGTCVTIDHGNGLCSKYMNISDTLPSNIGVGAQVDCGQLIASVKDTALIEVADDTHLHFEVLMDGNHVDPLSYVDYDVSVIAFED